MTITAVHLLLDTRATRAIGRKRSYVRKYLVTSDTISESEVDVYSADGIPAIGASHPSDLGAIVKSYDVEQTTFWHWHVTVNYDNEREEDQDDSADPLDTPPVFTYGSEKVEVQADSDRNGDKLLNTAGFPILGGLTRTRYRHTMQVERVEATFSNAFAISYKGKVNSDTFFGVDSDKVLCEDITCQTFTVNNDDGVPVKYYRVTYVFVFDPLGFATKVLSEGRYDASGKRIVIDGVPVSDPVPLDIDGGRAASAAAAHILSFNLIESASFAGLYIPEDT